MGEPNRRGHLQRVPPHDLATEAQLLGQALVYPDPASIVANDLHVGDFYLVAHQRIAEAIAELVADEARPDAGTVAAILRQRGQLDAIRVGSHDGPSYLNHLAYEAGPPGNAPRLAEMIAGYALKRRALGLASEVVEAVYSGSDYSGLVAELASTSEAEALAMASSWEPVNLAAVLAGEGVAAPPAYLARTDGVRLLYPGKIHAFNAEPETGKSMVAQATCAERIAEGGHALYIDFEDEAAGVIERLLGMGVRPAEILERFHYLHPEDPVDAGARLRVLDCLRTWPIDIAVIDGLAEALALSGWNEDKAPDVMAFYTRLPRAIKAKGSTCIILDHLGRDKENRGSYARGSGAKLAAIDGAAFLFEVQKPFGRGVSGEVRLTVTKDRPGFIRAAADGKVISVVRVESSVSGALSIVLEPPGEARSGSDGPTQCMAAIQDLLTMTPGLEYSGNQIETQLKARGHRFRHETIRVAAERLALDGDIRVRTGARNARLFSWSRADQDDTEGGQQTWEEF